MVSRYRNLILLCMALLAQLSLLAYQLRHDRDVPVVRYATVLVVTPFQKAFYATGHGVGVVWKNYVYLRGARRENEELTRQIDALKLENNGLREQAGEFQRLQALLNLRQNIPSPTAVAQVIGASSSETARMITIDKGTREGIEPDMPVVVPDGIVGKVLHVFPDVSQVLLITDPYSGVACLLEDSRVHGVLKGQNKPLCSLTYVPNGEEIKSGQRVITSGEDQIYPKGLAVGAVVDARPGPDFEQISVRPAAALDRIDEVLVFLSHPAEPAAPQETSLLPGTNAKASTPLGKAAQPVTAAGTPAPAARPQAATPPSAPPSAARAVTPAPAPSGDSEEPPVPPDSNGTP